MKKKHFTSMFIFIVFISLICAVCVVFGIVCGNIPKANTSAPTDTENVTKKTVKTVVIDAGHGGEDGGASSRSGAYEKDINLSIALMLKDYLNHCGIPVVLTRDSDVLLYDKNADHKGRKKIMDLASRLETAESTEDAIFVSIHMNAFPDTRYSGLQVWYSKNNTESYDIAKTIQEASKSIIPDNQRKVKAAGDEIYLLHKLECPAVLVECGFLSNAEEAELLATEEYQQRLAFMLFSSILNHV